MKESEYITVRNLSNIKVALHVLHDTLPDAILKSKKRAALIEALWELEQAYHKEIE